MKKLVLALFLVCLMTSVVVAANSTIVDRNFIYVIFDGTSSWSILTDGKMPNGCSLWTIAIKPNAANDNAIVRNLNATGIPIFDFKDTTGGGILDNYGGVPAKPYVVGTEVTAGSKMLIVVQ